MKNLIAYTIIYPAIAVLSLIATAIVIASLFIGLLIIPSRNRKALAAALGIALLALVARASQPQPGTVTAQIWHMPSTNSMAGLSTNDYYTNITAVFLTTTNVALPTNQWTVAASFPVTPLLSQGPPGTWWTVQFPTDGQSRFYAVVMTTGNGSSSPFSNLAPALAAPGAGLLALPLKVQ